MYKICLAKCMMIYDKFYLKIWPTHHMLHKSCKGPTWLGVVIYRFLSHRAHGLCVQRFQQGRGHPELK